MVASAAGQTAFTAGNLVVSQIGADGSPGVLTNAATAVFLKEITTGGTTVQSIAMPTLATVTGNHALTISGSASSEGALTRSVDGRYLVLTGYNADAGTVQVVGTSSSNVYRVVGRIDALGTVDTTTAMNDAYSANNIRSATTVDGSGFWVAGSGGAGGFAVRYVPYAEPTNLSTTITGSLISGRIVNIFAGQLYVSAQSGTFQSVATVGTGLPTTTGQIATTLPGKPTIAGPSAFDFWFANSTTLFIADDRSPGGGGGGIQKWTFDGSNWTLVYTLSNSLTAGCRGLAGKLNGNIATLYAVTADAITGTTGNKVVTVEDTDSSAAFSTVAVAPGNTAFRGVDFAPTAGGPAPCYANCDGSTSSPLLTANDFQCFLNAFAQSASYANCDGSTSNPVLTANDFQCFLNTYAAGCS